MSIIKKVPDLFPDQQKAVDHELATGGVFDTSEPGTGKTRVRITVFSKRRAQGAGCLLVLAPRSVLRSAWYDDFKRFAPWLDVSVATAANREKAFKAKADAYVTNHDGVKWLAKQPADFFKKFSALVIDESDAFKHHTSGRSKALDKILKHFKYRTCMNGLPSPNGICDVWNQVRIVDGGQRLGKSFYAFRSATCTPRQVGPRPEMVKWVDNPGAEEKVGLLIKDIVIRNELKNVPKNHIRPPIRFYMSSAQRTVYDQMRKEAVAELKSGTVSAINAAALATKLLQIASGAVYDSNGNYHVVSAERYELVADLIAARRHSVVFFMWTHQRDLLIEEFRKRGLTYMVIDGDVSDTKRVEHIRQYQDGMYRVALLHPKSAAHGVTMTRGKATIWPGPTHDLAHWIQGNARISRTGQTEETETLRIVADGTYEEKVYEALDAKNVKSLDLLRSLTE